MKLAAIALLAVRIVAQDTPAGGFEVASVKPADSGGGVSGGCHGIDSRYTPAEAAVAPPMGRCVIRDGRLSHMISIAWHLRSMSSLKGGPDWVGMGGPRFTLEAKVEDPSKVTEAQLYKMLQNLLIERFSIKMRQETTDVPGYALIVGKNGPKLHESKSEESTVVFGPGFKPSPAGPNTMTARKYTMAMLADMLTVFGERPVIDQTGLTGRYDFTLSWNETDGPSMVTALQEQLGLRYESRKVPETYIVIESAQKPSAN